MLQEEIDDIVKVGYLNGLFILARSIGLIGGSQGPFVTCNSTKHFSALMAAPAASCHSKISSVLTSVCIVNCRSCSGPDEVETAAVPSPVGGCFVH